MAVVVLPRVRASASGAERARDRSTGYPPVPPPGHQKACCDPSYRLVHDTRGEAALLMVMMVPRVPTARAVGTET
jgi:hypothetical protein